MATKDIVGRAADIGESYAELLYDEPHAYGYALDGTQLYSGGALDVGAARDFLTEHADGLGLTSGQVMGAPPAFWEMVVAVAAERLRELHGDWTYVVGCECEKCTDHHNATCAEYLAAARVDPTGELGYDCKCPEANGAIASHAAWAHPNCPIRDDE